ncbi:MAG TPA: phytanoyl-CoA dioxygenase family protein [Solirubrobacteraceae bacterium]|jgi:hypothetical protein
MSSGTQTIGSPRVTDEHLDRLRRHGWAVVENFLTPEELAACHRELAAHFPSAEAVRRAPERYRHLPRYAAFPFGGAALNEVSVHPELISMVERLLGTSEIELAESLVQAKFAAIDGGGTEENMHVDAWGPNQLAYPRDDGEFRLVPMILYYTDVGAYDGPTHVVSQEDSRGIDLLSAADPADPLSIPRVTHTRERRPDLYAREQPVLATGGSLFLMSTRTFHRGSAVLAEDSRRIVHFITYRASTARWMRKQLWPAAAPLAQTPNLHRFLESATPRQREMLGFPAPGDPYWTLEMVEGVGRRYPRMDMRPYREALDGGPSQS